MDTDEARIGNELYRTFKNVVALTEPFRQDPNDPFYQLLLQSREGCVREYEQKTGLLATRKWSALSDKERREFEDESLYLCPFKDDVWEHNIMKLDALNAPIIKSRSINNTKTAEAASGDEVGLKKVVYLAVGARVMLVMNLWTKAGLVNGTQGIVVACIADEAADRPPLAVLVRFPHYLGPRFPGLPETEEWRCVVPITSFTTTFFKSGTSCSRTQIPLALAWAVMHMIMAHACVFAGCT